MPWKLRILFCPDFCWRRLPDLHTISSTIKSKYDQAIKVSLQESPASLHSVEDEPVIPTTNHLVFMNRSSNYCLDNGNYTKGRQCIPDSIKSDIDAVPHHVKVNTELPTCEDLCCNEEYELHNETIVEPCNCQFIWCCKVICNECITAHNTYTCTE